MTGRTNAQTTGAPVNLVNIRITTDQASHTAVNGAAFTVSYGSESQEFTWNGTEITVSVPEFVLYTVTFSNVGGYITPEPVSFVAVGDNSTSVVGIYIYDPSIDLSKQDIHGSLIAQTTANCYVVKEPGLYKLPLVFGNALKNGAANSAAYTNNGGANSHDFVDYKGKVITSPYIEIVSGAAASAQLSIADTDGIFTDISIVDGSPCRYLQFNVASVPAEGANGVLSIKDSSGVVMWSWHIWVWEDDLTPVEITNATSVKYKILPVNLASKWDDSSKTHIKNWFYQFGRHNPMLCPAAYNSNYPHASYGVLGFTITSAASDLYNGIQNPATYFLYNGSDNNWFKAESGKTFNLWDAACTSSGNSDNNVVKTIYDPCPIGFKMPNGNTFTYFSIKNVTETFANGWKFKRYSGDTVGVFFPASGCRNYVSGSNVNVGQQGNVWLSSAYSLSSAYEMFFSSSGIQVQNYNPRSYGYSVRPVQE